jgi:hypothetical protein
LVTARHCRRTITSDYEKMLQWIMTDSHTSLRCCVQFLSNFYLFVTSAAENFIFIYWVDVCMTVFCLSSGGECSRTVFYWLCKSMAFVKCFWQFFLFLSQKFISFLRSRKSCESTFGNIIIIIIMTMVVKIKN